MSTLTSTLINWAITDGNLIVSVGTKVTAEVPLVDIAEAAVGLAKVPLMTAMPVSIANLVLKKSNGPSNGIDVLLREGQIVFPVCTFTLKPK